MKTIRTIAMIVVMISALASQGCMDRLIGEGVEATLGPQGGYFEEKAAAAQKDHKALEAYKRFELGEVKNLTGKFMPPEFLTELPRQFGEALAKSHLPKEPGGKTLVFRVNVIHYESASAVDNVFGPLEEVVARVELVDKDAGEVKAQGVAIGRTQKSINLGAAKKAEGLAKGLIKWASDYYPKPKKDEEKK